MSTDLAIEVKGLRKSFMTGNIPTRRRVDAVNDVSLAVKPGQVYGLLGPNGAGKSTTIKVLLGLIKPSDGVCRVFGRAPSDPRARADLGFLPENPMPYEYLTGREFVTFAAELGGVPRAEISRRVEAVIERVDMTAARDLQIRRYSKGMVQRISLAQALVTSPRLLVLDEPTSGLDVLGRRLVRDIMHAERAKGTTVLFSSHIIPDVEAICDEVALIVGGRTVKEGSVRAMLLDQQATVEVVLDGLDEAAARGLVVEGIGITMEGVRATYRVPPAQVHGLLEGALARKARVVSVNPLQYSLEDLFLAEVKKRGAPNARGELV